MTWPTTNIGEVCEVVSGATPKTGNPEFWGGDIAWVTPKDLSELGQKYLTDTPRKLTGKGLRSCSSRLLPPQSVLLSSRAPIGLLAINTIPVCTNQGFKSMVPRDGAIFADYLYWWLKLNREQVEQLGRGATFKEVSKKLVEGIQIPLPPLAEQKQIAGILDAADALRAKRRESLTQLDSLLQSTFLDMFGDPVTNPRDWDIRSGEELSTRLTVGIVVRPASYYVEKGVPALRSLNVRPHRIETENIIYFSKKDNETKLQKTRVWKDDLVLVRSGQPGTAAVVPNELSGVNTIDLLILTPRQELVHPFYLCHYFNSAGGRKMVLGGQRGQIQKHLNVGVVKKTPIPLPPIDLQHRFATIVESIEDQKARLRAYLAELDTLFASLQSRAFSGAL